MVGPGVHWVIGFSYRKMNTFSLNEFLIFILLELDGWMDGCVIWQKQSMDFCGF